MKGRGSSEVILGEVMRRRRTYRKGGGGEEGEIKVSRGRKEREQKLKVVRK